MQALYNRDIVAWANEQAAFLRSGQFDKLDLVNLADEIEDVGKSEKRAFAGRLAMLIALLLKWKVQPERQCRSWISLIKLQRKMVKTSLKSTPSLKACLNDHDYLNEVFTEGILLAAKETGLDLDDEILWNFNQILDDEFLPA